MKKSGSRQNAFFKIKNMKKTKLLFLDTETTGIPKNFSFTVASAGDWPNIVQLGFQVWTAPGTPVLDYCEIIRPDTFKIPEGMVHGISHETALEKGKAAWSVLAAFDDTVRHADAIVCHNADFDIPVLYAEYIRRGFHPFWEKIPVFCTQKQTTALLKIPKKKGQGGTVNWKWPSLAELHRFCGFGEIQGAHDARADVEATARCFFYILEKWPEIFAESYHDEYNPPPF